MNKALIIAAVFLASFTASLWLFMPYQSFIDRIIANAERNTGLKFSSEHTDERIFSTEYFGVSVNDREVGDVSFGHNPLMLIRKKTSVTSRGIYNADAVVSTDSMKFTLETTGQALDFIREPVRLEGRVFVEGYLTTGKEKSKIRIEAAKAQMPSPLGNIEFENVTAVVEIEGNKLNILSLAATPSKAGGTELDMSGVITLNKRTPALSDVDMEGHTGVLGIRKHLKIKGRIDNIHPIFD